jgi:hypothetical protein
MVSGHEFALDIRSSEDYIYTMNILSNPSKTVIFKTANGWFHKGDPNTFYPNRRLAREARRALGVGRKKRTATVRVKDSTATIVANKKGTPLEERAFRRMKELGVAPLDAINIVPFYGYNASVSYAHMRAAGATHDEAKQVIDYADPDVSRLYGAQRASGLNHADALKIAFDV